MSSRVREVKTVSPNNADQWVNFYASANAFFVASRQLLLGGLKCNYISSQRKKGSVSLVNCIYTVASRLFATPPLDSVSIDSQISSPHSTDRSPVLCTAPPSLDGKMIDDDETKVHKTHAPCIHACQNHSFSLSSVISLYILNMLKSRHDAGKLRRDETHKFKVNLVL